MTWTKLSSLRYGLNPDVPLVPGKPPFRSSLKGRDRTRTTGQLLQGNLGPLFGIGDMMFDPDYARRILAALQKPIPDD